MDKLIKSQLLYQLSYTRMKRGTPFRRYHNLTDMALQSTYHLCELSAVLRDAV